MIITRFGNKLRNKFRLSLKLGSPKRLSTKKKIKNSLYRCVSEATESPHAKP